MFAETDTGFRESLVKVLAVHLVLILAVWIAGRYLFNRPEPEPIVWLDGGGELGAAAPSEEAAGKLTPETLPPPDVPPPAPTEEPVPPEESSELAPEAKPTPPPKAKPTPTPAPRPKPTPTPQSTPKPPAVKNPVGKTPVPEKKKTSQVVVAKLATPRPVAKLASRQTGASRKTAGESASSETGTRKGQGSAAAAGTKGGPGAPVGSNEVIEGYFKKVEALLREEWRQPLTVVRSGQDVEAHVRLRAMADGTVESLALVKRTGNQEVDQSIEEALVRVRKVERPPSVLLKNGKLDELVAFVLEL